MNTASLFSPDDLYLFNQGAHLRLYDRLGAHAVIRDGIAGVNFAVWAPNAAGVSVAGDFNGWDSARHPMTSLGASGIWETWIAGVPRGAVYKYALHSRHQGYRVLKADPYALRAEIPPATASIAWDTHYAWGDVAWMADRRRRNALDAPIAIYEMHLGSWMRAAQEQHRSLTYRELAPLLADYMISMGFTHVEFMPVMEHPYHGSWGYQLTGYFAPTARYGTPQDFMHLVDHLHQRGIGVILDWAPSHFPSDEHGLGFFDGTHLYEHADPQQGFHPEWTSLIFNYGRHEVQSFLLSSAMLWFDRYHADGLRVDGVASMLYLDYARKPGEWRPNPHGGRENLEAVAFLRRLNESVYLHYPDVQTYAEESTAWPLVTRPTSVGGLGFGLKWDMGWMHDTLDYLHRDPIHRKHHHGALTFRSVYAFSENYVLPLSHDEVVHGKSSLLSKMPGDDWRKFANLRLLFGWMYAQPGKKLLFMGGELAQRAEWSHLDAIAWPLLEHAPHRGVQHWVRDLNHLYRSLPALHARDCQPAGFEWIDASDAEAGVVSFLRTDAAGGIALAVCNFTPVPRLGYRIGAPRGGPWRELLNSDASVYGGSGLGNLGGVQADDLPTHGRPHSLSLTLPPLAILILAPASTP